MEKKEVSTSSDVTLLILVAMILAFASYALALGHNGTLIASVLAFASSAAGYIYGKRKTSKD